MLINKYEQILYALFEVVKTFEYPSVTLTYYSAEEVKIGKRLAKDLRNMEYVRWF